MAQQNVSMGHLDGVDVPACKTPGCTTLLPRIDAGGMLICIVPGAAVVQRWVAGHWVDCASFHNGGILLAGGQWPFRMQSSSTQQSAAFAVGAELVASCFGHLAHMAAHGSVLQLPADPVSNSLAAALLASDTDSLGTLVIAHVSEVIAARVAHLSREQLPARTSRSGVLPAWRFRRVEALVQDRLSEEVVLADMASAAGLSPMHFAAQFKASTGMRPHQYLLVQRIEQAKAMLKTSPCSILEIALSVGFQTQAHFTTVFKRLEQTTPRHWRVSRMAA